MVKTWNKFINVFSLEILCLPGYLFISFIFCLVDITREFIEAWSV